ncbi:MAG: pirin, partial [Chloroflexota bacterium]
LQLQFGADYADTKSGRQGFKKGFTNALKKVQVVYPDANVLPDKIGILISPSKVHIARKK